MSFSSRQCFVIHVHHTAKPLFCALISGFGCGEIANSGDMMRDS